MVAPRCGPVRRRRSAGALQWRNSARALLRDACASKLSENNIRGCDEGAPMAGAEGQLALLAGASGLAGGYALTALLEAQDIRRVLAVSRRPLGREHPRLANRIVQFEHLEAQLKGASCDVALCCLGATLRQAGSQERFRAVDIECVLAFRSEERRVGKECRSRWSPYH